MSLSAGRPTFYFQKPLLTEISLPDNFVILTTNCLLRLMSGSKVNIPVPARLVEESPSEVP